MRVLSLLLVLLAVAGFASALTGEAEEFGVVDFESEVGTYETDVPAFLESDADAEVDADLDAETETETDSAADSDADSESDADAPVLFESSLPNPGQACGSGGVCSAKAAWCGTKRPVTGQCNGFCCTAGAAPVAPSRPATCAYRCQARSLPCGAAYIPGLCGSGANVCCPVAPRASTTPSAPAVPAASGSAFQTTAVARAGTWVTAKLRYCQAPRGGRDASDKCPRICVRQANPAWDAYRSDCSGLVSYAWGLPAPGVNTRGMATVSRAINCNSMQPGDAINRAGSHTMLFVRWVVPGTQAVFYEEPGCELSEPWARAVTVDLTCSGTTVRTARRGQFIAVRKNGQ